MPKSNVENNNSKYYKFSFCDNLEALFAANHRTSFPFHFHSTFNVTLVYNGRFNTQLNDRMVIVPSGMILITNPEEIHANPSSKNETVSFFTFYISREFVEFCNDNKPVFFEHKAIDDADLFSSLHALSMQLQQKSMSRFDEVGLVKTLKSLIRLYAAGSIKTTDKKQSLFAELLAEENLEKFSLAETAERFGIDKFKFIRLFKSQTGLTPNNYFIYRRIEKSKAMLAAGKDLLSIAIELGFYDASHFCNHFKKFTGISPIAFSSNG